MRTVKDYYGACIRKVDGLIGLEIEVEGKNLPHRAEKINKVWRIEGDPSLRGEDNAEYVLKNPGSIKDIEKALNLLKEEFKRRKSVIEENITAGVHVHLNFQENTLLEVFTFSTLYYCVENLLVKYCGDWREGNHFCLRSSDADYVIDMLEEAIKEHDLYVLSTEMIRYSSLNFCSLSKYGSLEFRSMRSTKDFKLILDWCNLLSHLKDFSLKFKTPSDVVEELSKSGPVQFIKDCFKGFEHIIKDVVDIEKEIRIGIVSAQDVAYCTNWDTWVEKEKVLSEKKKKVGDGLEFFANVAPPQLGAEVINAAAGGIHGVAWNNPGIPPGIAERERFAMRKLLRQAENRILNPHRDE